MADLSAAAAMDPITADAMAVHDSLRDVRAAATAGNANATSAACQAVAEAVARLNGDLDDDSRKRLQAALANLANKMKVHISHQTADFIQWTDVFSVVCCVQGLLSDAQMVARNPRDAAALAKLDATLAEMGDLTNTILEGARPAEGGMSAEDRLALSQAKVDNALAALSAAEARGDAHVHSPAPLHA